MSKAQPIKVPFKGELRPVDFEPSIEWTMEQIGIMADILSDDPHLKAAYLDELANRLHDAVDTLVS